MSKFVTLSNSYLNNLEKSAQVQLEHTVIRFPLLKINPVLECNIQVLDLKLMDGGI